MLRQVCAIRAAVPILFVIGVLALPPLAVAKGGDTWAARADRVCAVWFAHPVSAPKTRTKARLVVYVRRMQTQIAGVVKRHGAIRLVRRKAETRALNLERALLRQLQTVTRDLHSGVTRKFKRDFARLTAKFDPLARAFAAVRAPSCAYITRPG